MNKPVWFPFYVNDFLGSAKVLMMTTEEVGAYVLLLCYQWSDSQCSLPEDKEALQRISKSTTDISRILAWCFKSKRGRIRNMRLYKEWKKFKEISLKRSKAGKSGSGNKWTSLPSKYSHPDGDILQAEWLEMLAAYGGQCLKCGSTERIVRDHVIPRYQGGTNHVTNIQPLCRSCNSGKGPDTTDYRLNRQGTKTNWLPNASHLSAVCQTQSQSHPQSQPQEEKKKRERAANLPMPEDWSLSESMSVYAKSKGMTELTATHEFESCKEHHKKKSSKFSQEGWDASTWKTWVLKWVGYGSVQIEPARAVAPQQKCAYSNTHCQEYAVPGSKYCLDHKALILKQQERAKGPVMELVQGLVKSMK